MIPEIGKYIKCLLKNGLMIEGILREWNSEYVKLDSANDKSLLIVLRPLEEIVLIKIMSETPSNKSAPQMQEEIKGKLKEVRENFEVPDLKEKGLKELRHLVTEQEKQIIKDKIKDHELGDPRKVKYGYPGFFTKPRS